MKNVLKSSAFFALIALFIGVQFIGCSTDEVEPTDNVPVSDFGVEADNGMNAPSTIHFGVFFGKLPGLEYHWDFGNGDTSTEPLVNYTYYKPGTYTVTLTVTGAKGSSQTSKEITIGELDVKLSFLEGTWSIIRQEVTLPGSSTPIITEREMNWETLAYYGGNYTRFSLVWVEKEHGACSITNNILTQTPDNSDFPDVSILITSVDETIIEAEASIVYPDAGTITFKVKLQKHGSEYYSIQSFPNHCIPDGDFFNTTWSIVEETTKMMAYSSETDEYSDVISTTTESNIDYNSNTFMAISGINQTLWIDNWYSGVYQYYYNMSQVSGWGSWWINPIEEIEGDEMILQVVTNLDNNNLEMVAVWFEDIDDVNYKFENRSKFKRNDGTEAIISEQELIANWEVISKTETIGGINVNPGDSDSPPVGFVIIFNSDGRLI